MKSADLLNYAREAGINLRRIMEMEWILVVVRGFACFLPQCVFSIKCNGILGVLGANAALLSQDEFKSFI